MYFDKESAHWIVQSLRDKRFTLQQRHFKPDYPLGRILWLNCRTSEDQDSCDEKDVKNRVLTFTSCVEAQFTCDSGHCVDDIGYIFQPGIHHNAHFNHDMIQLHVQPILKAFLIMILLQKEMR